jgi:hypothetical protein
MQQKNTQSTKITADLPIATSLDFDPSQEPNNIRTHAVFALILPATASSPTVSMFDAKIHVNSTISNAKHGARQLGIDIKNYYLGTPMEYYQYIRVPISVIPQEVWDDNRYDIQVADDG